MSMARSRQAPLVKTAAPIVHAEDSQPNESIGKRRAIPSLVVPSQPPSRNDRKQWMNKRGGYQNPTGNYGESSSASGSRRGPYPTPIPPPRSAPTRDNPPYIPPIQTVHYPAAPPSFNRFAGPSNFRRSSLNNSSIFTPAPVHFMQTAAPPERESTLSMPIRAYPQIPFFAAGPSNIPTENTFNRPPPNPSSTAQPAPPRRPPPAVARVPSPHPSSTSTSASINSTDPTPAPQPAAAPSEQPTLGSPPPHKRRRVDEPTIKTEDAPVSLPRAPPPAPRDSSPPPTPQIKLEPRTPSPPPSPPPRRSATSGSKRYFPVPYDCTRASIDPEFVTNRRKWARSECGVLRDLGLKVAKFFFRDDGMVIEWTSAEPVWLDTLRPVKPRPRLPPPANEIIDLDAEVIDVDAEDVLALASLPQDSSTEAGDGGGDVVPDVGDVREEVSTAEDQGMITEHEATITEPAEDELQQLSLDFIQRYILTFDSDRAALARAYAEDAIFSFRDTSFESASQFTFQRARPAGAGVSSGSGSSSSTGSSSTSSKRTMPALPALAGYHYAPRGHGGLISVDYDTVVLDGDGGRVLLSVHGQLTGPAARTRAIDQSFVLRRNCGSADDGDWPLIAISHQMVVRDTPWVRWAGTLEGLKENGSL